jgi:UDP-N-acetylglucosamine 2-epimerase
MPEEINRLLTDRCSTYLFCPTETSVENLKKEGIVNGVFQTGDVMFDAALDLGKHADEQSRILSDLGLEQKSYLLCTLHRAENTNQRERLQEIVDGLAGIHQTVVFPVHPRTKKYLKRYGLIESLQKANNILLLEPVGFLDMIKLEKNAKKILTDSGGVQKEAYFYMVPCITLRYETEWVETVKDGWNVLVGSDKKVILDAVSSFAPNSEQRRLFGDGHASEQILDILKKKL